ncbi:MAG: 2,3-bisphosphoglycerate-independent phosphoglycerate mutase [Candidatus Doudnabacteria bacterium]|nr:2,3-bisphosphoglycerate-independent phosphoglycerate mutase [Candidatus Doudnabacteria bacterium]
MNHPVALIILDGWGHREISDHNAIAQAKTPFFDGLMNTYPHTLLNASEEHVGLPKGQIGNSEIGHMTMGTGRIIDVDLVKINKAAQNGEFHTNPAFLQLFEHVKKFESTLHVVGLVSPGGVHSHQEHLHEFLKAAKTANIQKIAIHAITDGRDLPPQSGAEYLKNLENLLAELKIGFIATLHGRFYAMDRDKNWERLAKTEAAIFETKGKIIKAKKPSAVLAELYKEGVVDEHVEPMVFLDETGKGWPISKNDGVFFFNYRPDRARQLTKKILDRKTTHNLCVATLTEYDSSFETLVAYPQSKIDTSLAAEISKAGLIQSHIAETEKYAHVTYFFDGGHEELLNNEHYFLIDSRRDVPTHDLAPEMRAREIADKAIERLDAGDDFLVMNFANADMVGHTANVPAIIKAVETVDRQLRRVVEKILQMNGIAIITADHGNAELNINETTGEKHTAHTTNLVPFILVSNQQTADSRQLSSSGSLADIAPTILSLMKLKKPGSMTGKNLLS